MQDFTFNPVTFHLAWLELPFPVFWVFQNDCVYLYFNYLFCFSCHHQRKVLPYTSGFPWLSLLQSFLLFLAIHIIDKYRQKEASSFFVCFLGGSHYLFLLALCPYVGKKDSEVRQEGPRFPIGLPLKKNRQHHEGVQSVRLLLPTPSMNRLGALLCSSIQGSVSPQVLTNFKRKRDNFTVGRPRGYHFIHIIKVNITINKHINISYPNVML